MGGAGGRTIQPSSVSSRSRRPEEAAMASGGGFFLAGEGLRAGQYMFVCRTLPFRASKGARKIVYVNAKRAVQVPEADHPNG